MLEFVADRMAYWFGLRNILFGFESGRKWFDENTPRFELISKICEEKHFNSFEEYSEWERGHIAERNEIFTKAGVKLG